MSFRSDLDAAHARISSLEGELQKARDEIERLQRASAAERKPPEPGERPKRRIGRVSFKRPRVIFPLVHLYLHALAVGIQRRPRLSKPTSSALIVWALWWVVLAPLVYVVWLPVYLILFVAVVAPWIGVVTLLLTTVITPIVLLSRLRIEGAGSDPVETGWLHGEISDEAALIYVWVVLAVTMPPLLPVFIPLFPE